MIEAPWNASWTGEDRFEVRACRWANGYPAVWQPHAPGEGKPLFAKPHFVRQRRSVAQKLCTVCGNPTGEYDRWCFPLGDWNKVDGRWMWLTTEAPVHHACASYAMTVCPRLRVAGFMPIAWPLGVRTIASYVGGPAVARDFGLVIPPTQRVLGALKLHFPDAWAEKHHRVRPDRALGNVKVLVADDR